MNALLRHPMSYFLGLGLLIFGADAALRRPDAQVIHLDAATVDALRSDLQRRGEAQEASIETAIEAHLDEEMLVREARRLGLAQGDPIVRRRLAQVMRFYLQEEARLRAPTEAQLLAHLAQHAARYQQPERISFEHHFFQGDDAARRRAAAAKALAQGKQVRSDAFAHGRHLKAQSDMRLQQRFGVAFATAAMALPEGPDWHPLTSSFGLHLLRLNNRFAAGTAKLEEVAGQLRQNWFRQRRAEAFAAGLAALRQRYRVQR